MAGNSKRRERRAPESGILDVRDAGALGARSKALVFISHDNRDADLAEAFSMLLSDVSAGTLKSFRSSDKKGTTGIEFGQEWYTAIMSQLSDATDVVALLTPRSVDRPWILYEAGVAKGKLDATVFGIALGVPLETVSTGPFGQFQNCDGDEDSLTKLVMQLLRRNPDAAPREEAVRIQVKVFLEKVTQLIKQAGKPKAVAPLPDPEQAAAKLFEEIKLMIRELPDALGDRVGNLSPNRRSRKYRRFHPAMLEEIAFSSPFRKSPGGGAAGLLMFFSLIKDEVPWMYEFALELYRVLQTGDRKSIRNAERQLMAAAELTTHHPIFQDVLRSENEELHFMLRHLPQITHEIVGRSLRLKEPSTKSAVSDQAEANE